MTIYYVSDYINEVKFLLFFTYGVFVNYIIKKYTNHANIFIKSEYFNRLDNYDKKFYVKKYNFICVTFCGITFINYLLTEILYDHLANKNITFVFNILLLVKCYLNSKNLINTIHLMSNVLKIDVIFTIDDF